MSLKPFSDAKTQQGSRHLQDKCGKGFTRNMILHIRSADAVLCQMMLQCFNVEWGGCFFRVLLFVWTQIKEIWHCPSNLLWYHCSPTQDCSLVEVQREAESLELLWVLLTQRWTRNLPQPIKNHLYIVLLHLPPTVARAFPKRLWPAQAVFIACGTLGAVSAAQPSQRTSLHSWRICLNKNNNN